MEEGETEVPLNYTGMLVCEEGGGKKEGGRQMNGEVIYVWCTCKYIHLMTKHHTHTYILYKCRNTYVIHTIPE